VAPVDKAMRRRGIAALRDSRIDHMSGVEGWRAMLAHVFATEPERFPLVESTTGLDPAAGRAIPRMSDTERVARKARDPGGRALTITLLVSIGLHLAAATAILLLARGGAVVDGPDKPTEVELVLEERKGDLHPAPPQAASTQTPPDAAADQPKEQQPRKAAREEEKPVPAAEPPVEAQAEAPKETVEPSKASVPAPAAAPTQKAEPAPASQPAPTISLSGTDSPSYARAWGDRILPAAPDAVFHNRPPEYPRDSATHGEHGTVVVLIHITSAGTAAGADVVRSSGYALLDRSAREAVLRWRFLPAVKDGQPVASDMQIGFIFDFE
jgi:periplasmic protein TonB